MGVCVPSAERISFTSHGECLILRCFYLPLKLHDISIVLVLMCFWMRLNVTQSVAVGALAQSGCTPALSLCFSYHRSCDLMKNLNPKVSFGELLRPK